MYIYFTKEILNSEVDMRSAPVDMTFVSKYVNAKWDFIKLGGRLNLKKTKNLHGFTVFGCTL